MRTRNQKEHGWYKAMNEEHWEYRLIDGNWSAKAVAYCTYHHGYLTEALMKVHKCKKRECHRLMTIEEAVKRAAERENMKGGENNS